MVYVDFTYMYIHILAKSFPKSLLTNLLYVCQHNWKHSCLANSAANMPLISQILCALFVFVLFLGFFFSFRRHIWQCLRISCVLRAEFCSSHEVHVVFSTTQRSMGERLVEGLAELHVED